MARIRVRLRGEAEEETTLLRAGVVTLDLRTRRATVGDRVVELTAREFALAETVRGMGYRLRTIATDGPG